MRFRPTFIALLLILSLPSFAVKRQERFESWAIQSRHSKAAIDVQKVWPRLRSKKKVVVAVVDTGIDPTHPFLKSNVVGSAVKKASTRNFGKDFSLIESDTPRPIDAHGHGTHVAGIIRSVYPKVHLLALKYFNPNASSAHNVAATIKALKYAVDQNVDIINYSGGGPESSPEELRILKEAEKKGILVVAAAGNEKSNIDQNQNRYYPASYKLSNLIAVSALDDQAQLIESSNWGPETVDIAAPGKSIKSSIPDGLAGRMTGTSQATAFVTGVAAFIMSNFPGLSVSEVKRIINESARKLPQLRGKVRTGGTLSAAAAFELAKQNHSLATKGTTSRKVATEGITILRKPAR